MGGALPAEMDWGRVETWMHVFPDVWSHWLTSSLGASVSLFGKWGKLSWRRAQRRRSSTNAGHQKIEHWFPPPPRTLPSLPWKGSLCWLALQEAGSATPLETSASLTEEVVGFQRRLPNQSQDPQSLGWRNLEISTWRSSTLMQAFCRRRP